MPKMIPKTIRELFTWTWKNDADMFDRVKANCPERWDGTPSVYTYGRAQDAAKFGDEANCGLTAKEAHGIFEEGGFGEHAYTSAKNGELCVNEHAAHALMSLMAEVTLAWEKYQKRLKTIPARREKVGR